MLMANPRNPGDSDEAGANRAAFVVDERKVRRWGAILWPSFFAAGVATMVFFAKVDPIELKEITWVDLEISREAGYTIGFFMFWAATSASSLFTWLLLRPSRSVNRGDDAGSDVP
jgi:hypothetical protein